MRTILQRDRTAIDDVDTVRRKSTVTVTDDTLAVPRIPTTPIVVWGKPSNNEDTEIVRRCLRWPLSFNKRCHNCAHFFDGVPVPLPISRDDLRNVYYCEGKFCSWQCAKSYNMRETSPAGRGNRNMYIALLAYKTWVKIKHGALDAETKTKMKRYCDYRLFPAPPRSNLVEFGGHLSIEEYRKDFCGVVPPSDIIENTSPYLSIRQMAVLPFIDTDSDEASPKASSKSVQHVKQAGSYAGTKRIETNRVQEFNNSFVDRLKRAKVDPDIMRRKKQLDVSNTLLSSMGIKIKKRSMR